jgi:hypothetical protein
MLAANFLLLGAVLFCIGVSASSPGATPSWC